VNAHLQTVKVWLKIMLLLLKYRIFSKGLFLMAHPVVASYRPITDAISISLGWHDGYVRCCLTPNRPSRCTHSWTPSVINRRQLSVDVDSTSTVVAGCCQ